ncbi:MAG: 3'-5' exonuclease domain-containing protein 2 [Bacteroidaceae bacterium]|nr:3'-5' exonuclease domain-containing protein 2 [Bacteroidaceae bacterium]
MIDIKNNITKADIAPLPTVLFGGRIIVVHSTADVEKAVNYLKSFPIVGIDTETRPSFAKGKTYNVSLLQISTEDTCFLFRLNYIGMPEALISLLQDERQLKVGLSLKDDIQSLQRKHKFTPRGFLDLQTYVKEMGIEAQSLQKLYALLFGQKISKSQRLTNWEADVLTDRQKGYAATDAWACVRMYNYLEERKRKQDYRVVEVADN